MHSDDFQGNPDGSFALFEAVASKFAAHPSNDVAIDVAPEGRCADLSG